MRNRRMSGLLLSATLLALTPAVLLAQYADTAMKKPMKDMPAAGMIHGSGNHMASGTIHVVGAMPTQKIHFTSEFKSDAGPDLHAVLSSDMMAGPGSVDLGMIKNGENLIDVPRTADAHNFSQLLVVDSKQMVVASTMIPGGKMGKHEGMMKDTAMAMPMKKDSMPGKPR